MRFTITPPAGGQAYLLGDDTGPLKQPPGPNYQNGLSGHVIEGYLPEYDILVQKSNLVRSANPFGAPRLNQSGTIRFTVVRIFSSFDDCVDFLDDLQSLVPIQGELTRTNTSTGRSRFLPSVFREQIRCSYQKGVRCDVTYQFWSNSFWRTNP